MEGIQPYVHRILDRARWAPSGDNTQPWRFEVAEKDHIVVHGYDTRDHVVYDLDGHSSQLAIGALLETIGIAATAESYRAHVTRRPKTPESHCLFDVYFHQDVALAPDPLVSAIETRVVQRRPMSTRPLTKAQKTELADALPAGYQVIWFEGLGQRRRLAKFMFDNAKIRLIIPEAYEVHKSVIEWGKRFSSDRIPEQAVGVDPLTARFMRWAMASWERVSFFNTRLMGHVPLRIQLDLLPGLFCAAHFALLAPARLHWPDDYVASGRAMQRFWLTAARLGLFIQPEMTPVIFTRYHRHRLSFTATSKALSLLEGLSERLTNMLGDDAVETAFFMGRLGAAPAPRSRSIRHPLKRLMLNG